MVNDHNDSTPTNQSASGGASYTTNTYNNPGPPSESGPGPEPRVERRGLISKVPLPVREINSETPTTLKPGPRPPPLPPPFPAAPTTKVRRVGQVHESRLGLVPGTTRNGKEVREPPRISTETKQPPSFRLSETGKYHSDPGSLIQRPEAFQAEKSEDR